jgi:hypothetical protein
MDNEILYSVFGIIGLLIIAFITLRAGEKHKPGLSKEERCLETIENYKKHLKESLRGYEKGNEDRKAKKIMILSEYSEELTFNVLFDEEDKKNIILALAGE